MLAQLEQRPDCVVSTAAHPIHDPELFANPNVVKVVLDARSRLVFLSGPHSLVARRPVAGQPCSISGPALRHIGIYGYRAGFLRRFRH